MSGDGREWKYYDSGNTDFVPGEGGVHSFIWPRRVYAARYGSLGLESYTGFKISLFSLLSRVSFWTGSLKKSIKLGEERSTFVVPIVFL